jgi:mannose-1-phosphate guanylyltransferase
VKKTKNSIQSIILVGGEGTRLRPLTLNTPKPLLTVAGTPIVEHQLNKLSKVKVDDVVLATAYKKNVFTKYLTNHNKTNGTNVAYSYESTPLGTGGAIRKAYDSLPDTKPDTPVVIWNGDIISNVDLTVMLKKFKKSKADVMLYLTEVENPYAYGLVETANSGKVKRFIEKPAVGTKLKTRKINAGVYIFKRHIIEKYIPANTVVSVERETFPQMIENGVKIFGYTTDDYWMDVGTPDKYVQTNMDAMSGKIFDIESSSKYVSDVNTVVSVDTKISETATLDCVMVETGAVIGDESNVERSYVGKNVHIGNGCVVKNCVIGEGSIIGDGNVLENLIINNGSTLSENALKVKPT